MVEINKVAMSVKKHVDNHGNIYWIKSKAQVPTRYMFYDVNSEGEISDIWQIVLPGTLHNDHSPAVIFIDGRKEWWREGLLHRKYGPAIQFSNGIEEWYLYGRPIEDSNRFYILWKEFINEQSY